MRAQTVVEIADEIGYAELPTRDPVELDRWFRESADSGSLVRYLQTFDQTVAVMQTEAGLHRIAKECVLDLAADGVVYAESRYAPEQHIAEGLTMEQVIEAVNAAVSYTHLDVYKRQRRHRAVGSGLRRHRRRAARS